MPTSLRGRSLLACAVCGILAASCGGAREAHDMDASVMDGAHPPNDTGPAPDVPLPPPGPAPRWSAVFGDNLRQTCDHVAVASDGRIGISGGFQGVLTIGASELRSAYTTASTLDVDGFYAVLEANGDPIVGRAVHDGVLVIAKGAPGELALGGTFPGTIDLGTGPMTALGETDFLAARLTTAGEVVSAFSLGADRDERLFAVAARDDGSLLVSGAGRVTYDAATRTFSSIDSLVENALVAELDEAGAVRWATTPSYFLPMDVVADATGGAVILARIDNGADFGGGPIEGLTNTLAGMVPAVAHYDSTGAYVSSRAMDNGPSEGWVHWLDLEIDDAGSIYVAIDQEGHDLDAGLEEPPGTAGALVVKYTAMGEPVWITRLGGPESEAWRATRLGWDAAGRLIVIAPVGSDRGSMGVFAVDASSGETLASESLMGARYVLDAAVTPDGDVALCGGDDDADGYVSVWVARYPGP